MIRIAIADDHKLFREGLIKILQEDEEIDVDVEASNGGKLLDQLRNTAIDILLLDIQMPGMSGKEVAPIVRKDFPKIKIIALSMFDTDEAILEMVEAGAVGYLLKDSSSEEVIGTIKKCFAEGVCFNNRVQGLLQKKVCGQHQPSTTMFGEKEKLILQLVSSGLTNKEIAERLKLSVRTVEGYRQKMVKKTRCKSFSELLALSFKRKWF